MPTLEETLFDDDLARVLAGGSNDQARERLVDALAMLIAGDVDLENDFPLPLPVSAETVKNRFMHTVAMLSRAVWDAQGACTANERVLDAEMAAAESAAAGLH
jgi:hypothetical protein